MAIYHPLYKLVSVGIETGLICQVSIPDIFIKRIVIKKEPAYSALHTIDGREDKRETR